MASAAAVPTAAYAQTSTPDTDKARSQQPDDIVVTAQRYKQRLQDVPLSVRVVDAKEVAARGVTDLKDMEYAIPGLSTYDYGVSKQSIQMRGVANVLGSSTVGLYFDETPIATDTQGDSLNIRLLDMERVEVLRGPQATLYGQSSMGGTIRYIPAAPKLDEIGGSFEGEYSSTRYGAPGYKAVGVINLPLSTDKLGLRVVGGYERIGGYIDRVGTGEEDINSADVYTVRASLLARPSDRLTLSLIGLYQDSKQANQDFGVNYKTTSPVPSYANDRYALVEAKLAYDLGFAELSFAGSYIDRHSSSALDLSYLYVPLLPLFGFPVGYIDRVGLPSASDSRTYYGEARLSSQNEGPLGWQIGATYRDTKTDGVAATETAPNDAGFTLLGTNGVNGSKAYAVYGEVNYAFSPQLKAIVGLRYFSDHKRQNSTTTNFGLASVDVNADTFHSVNPRFNLSYAFTTDSMVYVNVAKGFRSGGFNAVSAGFGVIPIQPSYDPDHIWTYEVGTKHQLLNGKLFLDASVYRSEWSKVQSSTFAPGSTITIVTNSGEVAGWGIDLSATARPTRTLTLTGTYGWNNLAFKRAVLDKAVGDPVDGAVREAWSASLDFRPPLSDKVTGLFRVDYQHAGKAQLTFRNIAGPPVIPRPARDLVNMRVGATVGPVEIALFANNLFDVNVPNIIGPFAPIAEDLEQRPRVIGIAANFRF
jgi:outer membrane receptor protein involved in Fe transport